MNLRELAFIFDIIYKILIISNVYYLILILKRYTFIIELIKFDIKYIIEYININYICFKVPIYCIIISTYKEVKFEY